MNNGLLKNLKFEIPTWSVFSGIILGIAGRIVIGSLSNSEASFKALFRKTEN